MWIYGFLKIVPSQASFSLFGATIGPTFLGGMLFPAALFGVLTLTPWIDRTNRRVVRRFEYLEPVRQSPLRLASGVATLVFIGTLFVAAYYDTLGLSLAQIWAIVLGVPLLAGLVTVDRRHAHGADRAVRPARESRTRGAAAGRCHARARPRAGAATNLCHGAFLDRSLLTQPGLDGP